jgi:hypothetical protein
VGNDALGLGEGLGAPAVSRFARTELALTGARRLRRNPAATSLPGTPHRPVGDRRVEPSRDVQRLTLSEATVRTHLEHVYTKLGVHSARELMTSKPDQLTDADRPEPTAPPTDDPGSRRRP